MGGVKLRGLLDTGSQTTLMQQSVFAQHFLGCEVERPPSLIKLKAVNGLSIPCKGYIITDFVIEGHCIAQRGVFIVEDDFLTNPLIIGMNVVQACWDEVFHNDGPVSFSCQNPRSQSAWRTAFAMCQRVAVTGKNDFFGHVRLAHRKVTIPARSEMMVWGRARMGPRGRDYCGLVETLEEPGALAVARTVATVRRGRIPLRIRNLNSFAVPVGRYQKLGRIYCIQDEDIYSSQDVCLVPGDEGVVEVGLVGACDPTEDGTFEVMKLADRPDLTEDEQGRLKMLLQKWTKVFSTEETDFGRTSTVRHCIPTGDSAPIRERFRPLPPLLYKDMRALLTNMLQSGVIVESSSPWAAPIVMVKKKDGSWRFCVDYRKLNAVTHKDAFPLPRIEETLTSMTQAAWFSTLDLASGYWQVEMDPHDREKTAFTMPVGLSEFQRMPFGLCNAPATFQRLMQQCLSGQITDSVLVYLDDIIVYSADFNMHLSHLEEVFERLQKNGLKLRPDKCKLFHQQVKFLGHVVNQKG
uniref:ribonuclease H n=1 Tax=Oryzias sinensis TaxID=183150 RepID=A0A8C7WZ80_9TELE